MYKKWLARIQNALDVQKDLQTATISMVFTRHDLIELRVLMQTLIDLDEMNETYKEMRAKNE